MKVWKTLFILLYISIFIRSNQIYRNVDILKTYNSGASTKVYRVSFPPLTLPFQGRVGDIAFYPSLRGRRFRCPERTVLRVFSRSLPLCNRILRTPQPRPLCEPLAHRWQITWETISHQHLAHLALFLASLVYVAASFSDSFV